LKRPVALFVPGIKSTAESYFAYQSAILSNIGLIGIFLIAFIFIVYSIKRYFEKNSVFLHNSLESSHTDRLQSFGKLEHPGSVSKKISFSPTWGCGYTAPNP